MTGPDIFIAISTFGEYGDTPLKLLRKSGRSFTVNPLGRRLSKEEVIELGKNSIGILAGVEPYDKEVLEKLDRLKCISRCGVGLDNIDLSVAKEREIAVRNTPNVVIQPVAEMTVAMIFDLLRKLTWHTSRLKERRWEKQVGGVLAGKVVGIVGLGRIGKKVAEILGKLDAVVIGMDLNPDFHWAQKNKVKIVPLEELLRRSDIVSVHLATIPGVPFRLEAKDLQKMKKGAFLINVARGGFVDEAALYATLKSGHLGGSATDVFEEEPYAGPLCDLDNVVLTPHIATLTLESRVAMELEATQNLLEGLRNR